MERDHVKKRILQKMLFAGVGLLLIAGLSATAQWNTVNATGIVGMSNIHFQNQSLGFGVGTDLQHSWVQKTTDGGKSWRADLLQNSLLFGLNASDNSTIFATGQYGECNCAFVLRSTDAGVSWQAILEQSSFGFYDIEFPTPTTGYTGGYDGVITKTTDNGETWSKLNTGNDADVFLNLDFPDVNTGYGLAGVDGNFFSATRIYKTTDAGMSWNVLQDYQGMSISDIKFRTAQQGLMLAIIDGTSSILSTNDGGENWSIVYQYENQDEAFWRIQLIGDQTAIAVGSNGLILRSTDNGLTWTEESSGSSAFLLDIALAGDKPVVTTDDSMLLERAGEASNVTAGNYSGLKDLSLNITPSVVTNETQVRIESTGNNSGYMLLLYDQLGRTLQTIDLQAGQRTVSLQTEGLSQGVYFLQVVGENGSSETQQMVVQ